MLLSGRSCDVLSVGRVGVDVYPTQIRKPLDEVENFTKFLGGSAANVAVAASRYGHRTALISKTGNDPFGRFIHRQLRLYGVDDCFVGLEPASPTPVTFCEIFPPENFPIFFYRTSESPDMRIREEELPLRHIRAAEVFWATLTGLSAEPSRQAHFAAWEERNCRRYTIIDLDYRPKFWPNGGERESAVAALKQCNVAVGNTEECWVATGERDPKRAAKAMLDLGVEIAVVKRGPEGAMVMTHDEVIEAPTLSVSTLNGLGAGDGFGGALCHGLISGWELGEVLRFANTAGALVASRLETSAAMPSEDEVRKAMERLPL
ncbi:MAG: 5-dehydro-2-deoxygluconokinase [Propionibacteriaceae bacterium]|jgi:5-dehydro-2-deoxygluconokinase|nr:5-dehydro-2-deoxygluconokinase [Propionibacteriaceae bacterium]